MRIAELFLALPWLYLLFALRAFLPLAVSPLEAFLLVVIVIGMVGWARPARLVRGVVLSVKERDFVRAARGFGASDLYLLRRHIFPETASVLLTQAAILVPQFVLAEMTLSFLGLGVPEPISSWGNLLATLQQYSVLVSYWWMYLPALAIVPFFLGYLRSRECIAAALRHVQDRREEWLEPIVRKQRSSPQRCRFTVSLLLACVSTIALAIQRIPAARSKRIQGRTARLCPEKLAAREDVSSLLSALGAENSESANRRGRPLSRSHRRNAVRPRSHQSRHATHRTRPSQILENLSLTAFNTRSLCGKACVSRTAIHSTPTTSSSPFASTSTKMSTPHSVICSSSAESRSPFAKSTHRLSFSNSQNPTASRKDSSTASPSCRAIFSKNPTRKESSANSGRLPLHPTNGPASGLFASRNTSQAKN